MNSISDDGYMTKGSNPKASEVQPNKELDRSLSWIHGDDLDTGLPSHHFDGAVKAYGLRNLSDPQEGLKELHRVLKPGGRAGVLDFNQLAENSIRARFQKFYLIVKI